MEILRLNTEVSCLPFLYQESPKNKKDEELNLEFKLPDYLKITPADSEIQRLTKRKRVKALKNSHKQKHVLC